MNELLNLIPSEVHEIGKMHFEGNITPHSWYEHIRFKNGKVDYISTIILSEIIYWYRPTYHRDEVTGKVTSIGKKFKGDALQKSKKALSEQFGLTERQVKDSLCRLEELKLIIRDYRVINGPDGMKLSNVLFIKINTSRIEEITFSHKYPYDVETSYPRRSNVIAPTLKRHTYTEITTKTTTKEKEGGGTACEQARDATPTPIIKSEKMKGKYQDLEHKVYYQEPTGNYKKQKNNNLIEEKDCNLEKQIKLPFGDYVKLSQDDYETLCGEIGKEVVDYYIQSINNHVPNAKREYKCYKSAIRQWNLRDQKEGKQIKFFNPQDNGKLAEKIYHELRPTFGNQIQIGNGYIEFISGMWCLHLKFDDKDFNSKLEAELPKWRKNKKAIG